MEKRSNSGQKYLLPERRRVVGDSAQQKRPDVDCQEAWAPCKELLQRTNLAKSRGRDFLNIPNCVFVNG